MSTTPTPPEPPRGVRNNNPLNIKASADYIWRHQTGIDSDGYLIFAEPIWGLRAAAIVLHNYVEHDFITTLQRLIWRWAPPRDNPSSSYLDFVQHETGISARGTLDLATQSLPILKAMAHFECGYQPYPDGTYEEALKLSHIR